MSGTVGCQYIVDALDCEPKSLQSLETIERFCQQLIQTTGLTVLGTPQCHQFGAPHGVTILYLLSESHLACHTYPEHGTATFNLVCCRDQVPFDWQSALMRFLGTTQVRITRLERGELTRAGSGESPVSEVVGAPP